MKTEILSEDTVGNEIARLALLRHFPADNTIAMKTLIEILQRWCTGATRYNGEPKRVTPQDQLHHVIILTKTERWEGNTDYSQYECLSHMLYPTFRSTKKSTIR